MVLTRHEPSRTYPAKFSPKFTISTASGTTEKPSVDDVGADVIQKSLSRDSKTFVQRVRQEAGE